MTSGGSAEGGSSLGLPAGFLPFTLFWTVLAPISSRRKTEES
jgi:hypothetical protein